MDSESLHSISDVTAVMPAIHVQSSAPTHVAVRRAVSARAAGARAPQEALTDSGSVFGTDDDTLRSLAHSYSSPRLQRRQRSGSYPTRQQRHGGSNVNTLRPDAYPRLKTTCGRLRVHSGESRDSYETTGDHCICLLFSTAVFVMIAKWSRLSETNDKHNALSVQISQHIEPISKLVSTSFLCSIPFHTLQ